MTIRMKLIGAFCIATVMLFLVAHISGPYTKNLIATASLLVMPVLGNLLMAYGGLLLAVYSFPEEMNNKLQTKVFFTLLALVAAAIIGSFVLLSDTRLLEYTVNIGDANKQGDFDSCLEEKRDAESRIATRFVILLIEPINIGLCSAQMEVKYSQLSITDGRIDYESNKDVLKLILTLLVLAVFLLIKAFSVKQVPTQIEDRRQHIFEFFILFFLGVAFQTVSSTFS